MFVLSTRIATSSAAPPQFQEEASPSGGARVAHPPPQDDRAIRVRSCVRAGGFHDKSGSGLGCEGADDDLETWGDLLGENVHQERRERPGVSCVLEAERGVGAAAVGLASGRLVVGAPLSVRALGSAVVGEPHLPPHGSESLLGVVAGIARLADGVTRGTIAARPVLGSEVRGHHRAIEGLYLHSGTALFARGQLARAPQCGGGRRHTANHVDGEQVPGVGPCGIHVGPLCRYPCDRGGTRHRACPSEEAPCGSLCVRAYGRGPTGEMVQKTRTPNCKV
jgi:hypothetical protein